MARLTAPSSRSREVDVRQWLGGIRLSGFMLIMLGLVVLAAFVLVPTFGMYLEQRQQIAGLERAVTLGEQEVAELEASRDRWGDPAYITTQARERLYYTHPGEVVFLVDNDLPAVELPQEQAPVSSEVEETESDWMTRLIRSITTAGVTETVTYEIGVPDAPQDQPAP
ncbi:septum formation initiator family protein [Microbacterium sp. zg.Y1090]|uniref:FtsB family cell division protein n=1 Tax=Microbacterium TaxID=33882 RepID=UPI00214B2653|nr:MULTISPECIES: septum formation initiator family protein [unclassified Microbacterium]MCR2812179.1 septum formation initiator family protein [Microbacterium sp. zg.Y1084]MCR2818383.1 septum formation initiator family protein [Microbacterium sp. zg.Y1090]MDL5486196.1 septum formation initiator family protein [Microbacterium sp. zg-Y1211]WIM29399.1 septum formation initiator family protein [Microbacterium sp. zg-Y1090]